MIATIMLTLIAVHVAAGEEDLATQIRALKKERLETLTRLVKIYTLQYEAGAVSGEVFADAETALVNAQLDAALANLQLDAAGKLPDAVITIVENADAREADALKAALHKNPTVFVETGTDFLLWPVGSSKWRLTLSRAEKNKVDIKEQQKGLIEQLTSLVENYKKRYKTGTAPLEALVRAHAALLDARMNAAEKYNGSPCWRRVPRVKQNSSKSPTASGRPLPVRRGRFS
jgi:hypothetical protein